MRSGGKLARHTGLRRFARLPQVRKEPRRPAGWLLSSGQPEPEKPDPVYLARVRTLPCLALTIFGHRCGGPVQAHHAGEHAAGKKAPDSTAVPLCLGGHMELHDFRGPFRDYTRTRIRNLENLWIELTRKRLGWKES